MNLKFWNKKPKEVIKQVIKIPIYKVRTQTDTYKALDVQKTDTLIRIPREAYGILLNERLSATSIMIPVSNVTEIVELGEQEVEV